MQNAIPGETRRNLLRGLIATTMFAALPRRSWAADAPFKEGAFVPLNGVEQWVAMLGDRSDNPIVLILGGGPGTPTSYLAPLFDDWLSKMTVILWDQPGSGGTFLKNGGEPGIGPVTVDRFARDGIALSEYLLKRFNRPKLILVGFSWGSMVGLTMASRRPDLFSAYVGAGQAVDVRRADQLSYALVIEAARQRNDAAAVAALEQLGPPPYSFDQRQTKQRYATAQTALERANAARIGALLTPSAGPAPWIWPASLGPYDARTAFLATQRASYADAQAWTARALGHRFKMPILFVQGEQDANTVTSLVQSYAAEIKAPRKQVALIPGAGHNIIPYCVPELRSRIEAAVLPIVA